MTKTILRSSCPFRNKLRVHVRIELQRKLKSSDRFVQIWQPAALSFANKVTHEITRWIYFTINIVEFCISKAVKMFFYCCYLFHFIKMLFLLVLFVCRLFSLHPMHV